MTSSFSTVSPGVKNPVRGVQGRPVKSPIFIQRSMNSTPDVRVILPRVHSAHFSLCAGVFLRESTRGNHQRFVGTQAAVELACLLGEVPILKTELRGDNAGR